MQRLNIPLRRYQHTTRLSRRVVALFLILGGIAAIVLSVVVSAWYRRDTTSAAAPQGTVAVFHFLPNRATWNDVERALGDITLISGRPLTAADIRPFAFGEFSVFVEADGSRSVAVRVPKDRLPTEQLDSLHILATEFKKDVYLLSDTPKARMSWKPARLWTAWPHLPTTSRIGSVHFLGADGPLSGVLLVSNDRVRIRVPKQTLPTFDVKKIPNDALAVLATPILPNVVSNLTNSMDATSSTPSATLLADHFSKFPGRIILTKTDKGLRFLLVSSTDDFEMDSQVNLIRTAAALKNPKIQSLELPDQTKAEELVVDPTFSTVEEITVAGSLVSRVGTRNGEYLYRSERSGEFAITDDVALLEQWLRDEYLPNATSPCGGNAGFVRLRDLLTVANPTVSARTSDPLSSLANQFGILSIQNRFLHTTIDLCL